MFLERIFPTGALALALIGAPLAQEAAPEASVPAAAAAPAAPAARTDAEILGEPIVVNGETISHNAIKRHLALGSLGQPYIQNLKLKAYMDEEIARRETAGEDVSRYQVTAEDVQAAIDEAQANVEKEYPGQNLKLEDVLPMRPSNFEDQVRQTQRFDRMFLPENPNEFPAITKMALEAGANGAALLQQLTDGWDDRMARIEAGEDVQPDPQSKNFLTMLLRQLVIKYLDDNAEVEAPETGLPDHLALRVNGQDIHVDTIWQMIRDQVTPQAVEDSRSWLVNTTLARQALESVEVPAGEGESTSAWLTDEEFAAAYEAHSGPYKASPFSVEMIAVQFKKFPSVNDYRLYFRITESFKRMIQDEMTDEALLAHGKSRTNQIVAQAKVDVDVLLCSAYDFKNKTWKENGWEAARREAIQVAEALTKGDKTFDELLEEHSDYYDPPIAESQREQLQPGQLNDKGRFRGVSRNDLLQKTFESDFSIFLNGNSIADEIFFEMEVGKIGGPWRGQNGWYIARLNKRIPAARTLNPSDPSERSLLEQEFIASRLNDYVQTLYDGAKIQGL
ncbi:MAG: peptidyl-prolyl cis-trans isomerase [Planctomycetota bacterium]